MNIIRILFRDLYNPFKKYNDDFYDEPMLPEKEKAYVKEAYLKSNGGILEFGSGGSTVFAVKNKLAIVSIESDKKFKKALSTYLDKLKIDPKLLVLLHVDIGKTGKYGFPFIWPFQFKISEKGLKYVLSGFLQFTNKNPSIVLVDGRWRVSCCLYAVLLKYNLEKTTLLLDDYEKSRNYMGYIEKYFSISFVGRMVRLRLKNVPFNENELLVDFFKSLSNPT